MLTTLITSSSSSLITHRGWPLNVFLTPDLKPVFGGTYWPGPSAVAARNMQLGFQEVLEKVGQAWKDRPAEFLSSATDILQRLREFTDEGLKGAGEGSEETLEVDLLEEAYQQFNTRYDPIYGGFGRPSPCNCRPWEQLLI